MGDERAAALAAMEAAERAIQAARRLLEARPASSAGAKWITLDEVAARLGTRTKRTTQEALGRLGVPVVRAGHARSVDATALDAAMAARAVLPRHQGAAPAHDDDDDDDAPEVSDRFGAALAAARGAR